MRMKIIEDVFLSQKYLMMRLFVAVTIIVKGVLN